jgi:hypothetical protein
MTVLALISDTSQPYPVAKDEGKHKCIKWEPLENWMGQLSFDPFEPDILIHPIYGRDCNSSKL